MALLSSSSYISNVPVRTIRDNKPDVRAECSRLLHAAVINKRFRESLLSNPLASIEAGYCGEKFQFTREQKERMNDIRATSLEDFAAQLMHVIERPVVCEYAYFAKH